MVEYFDIQGAITYLIVLLLACFGGVVDFVTELQKSREKYSMRFILFSLFARLLSAAFAGLLMFWILQSEAESGTVILTGWSAASIAMAGYLGDNAIKVFMKIWQLLHDGKQK